MAVYKATKEEGVKEVVAKDFVVFPLIFSLLVSRDIVEPVPKRKINLTAIAVWEFRGIYFLGFESKTAGPCLPRSKEQVFGQCIWGIGWLRPEVGQVSSIWPPRLTIETNCVLREDPVLQQLPRFQPRGFNRDYLLASEQTQQLRVHLPRPLHL